jgi:hypothetical protein
MLDALLASKPDSWRRIGRGWMIVGLLGGGFLIVAAVSVFGFGEPVVDRNAGEVMRRSDVAFLFLVMGSGFAFFALAGRFVLSRLKR